MKRTFIMATFATALCITGVQARDQVRVVGSSTVFPFSSATAEQFGKRSKFETPVVEATGTGGGFKLFCAGIGPQYPDVTGASRSIKPSETELCASNGISKIVEVKFGFDGIVLAHSRKAKPIHVTRRELFQVLAKQVPINGNLVDNPYERWSDINPSLPNIKIEVLGPPPTSGTRDAWLELVMEAGCSTYPILLKMKKNKKKFHAVCHALREDGAFIEVGEQDNLIVQKLRSNSKAFGIFGFSFLDQNSDSLQGASIDGHYPSIDSIAEGSYPVSRPLFVYVKKAHVGLVSGLYEYISEIASENASGMDGYLTDRALIPLPQAARYELQQTVQGLK